MSLTITSPTAGSQVSGTVTITGTSIQSVNGVALSAQSYSTTVSTTGLLGTSTLTISNSSGNNASVSVIANVSASNTEISAAGQSLVDTSGNVYTLTTLTSGTGSGTLSLFENGAQMAGNYDVADALYYTGNIYIYNTSGQWYEFVSGAWTTISGDPRTPTASPSGSYTTGTAVLTDSLGGTWYIDSSQQIVHNRVVDGTTSGVVIMYYINGSIYQENTANNWYEWLGSAWSGIVASPLTGGSGSSGGATSSQTLIANTSAVSTTPAFTNGTLPGNTEVSKVNLHNLLYAGHTTQILAHWIPWFDGGDDSGINVNYNTSSSTYVTNMVNDMISRGIDGVFIDWQGQTDISNTGALELQTILSGGTFTTLQGNPFKYAIMLDANFLSNGAESGSTNQAKVNNAMSYINTHYLGDVNYLTHNSKKVVGDFGLTAASGINWGTINSNYSSVSIVHLDNATSTDGFGITDSGGSFLWVTAGSSPSNTDTSANPAFYTRALTHTSQIAVGAVFKGFASTGTDGTNYAPWDGSIYLNQQDGQTWLTTWNYINSAFSTTHQLPFVQIITWDDYYEGTPIETGIDNALSLSIAATGRVIAITASSISTTDHYELWTNASGSWASTNYAANVTSITVTAAGSYILKSVGSPCIKNTVSNTLTIS